MEILEYYVNKRQMVKHQNNSSESDHLDKVVMPPSLGMGNTAKSNTMSNRKSHRIINIQLTTINCTTST